MQEKICRFMILIVTLAMAVSCSSEQPEWNGTPAETDHDPDAGESALTPSDLANGVREGDWLLLDPIDAPAGVWRVGVLVGLTAEGPVPALEARLLVDGYPMSEWTPLGATWSEVDHHVAIVNFSAVGNAAQLRVHVDALDSISFLQWSAVRPDTSSGGKADDGSDYGTMFSPLRSDLLGLGIVTREAWGARSSSCSSNASKYRMTIHHTETPSDNPERRVRAIQNYHKDTRGWCDIGYHFLIGVDGTIFEGRPLEKLGAHVGGQNTGNIGISFIGCFHPGCSWGPTTPPDAALDAAARLIEALSDIYGIDLSSSVIKGHRDWPGASTDCPGDNLEARIDDIIDAARSGSLPYETPELPDPPSVDPSECGSLDCGACAASAACGWCAARGSCGASTDACTWGGSVGGETCWSTLWPCAVASCWNPTKTAVSCGAVEWDEDFSSGSYSVHRYWTNLPGGGPVTIRFERTAGSFEPAILVADRAGRLAYGGEVAALHPDIAVLSALSGRGGGVAEVRLQASRDTDIYLYLTGWAVLDDGFRGFLPRDSRYHASLSQPCSESMPTPSSGPYDGLTQSGSEIPRAGLYNPTMAFLGTTTEPYGSVITDSDGLDWVRGKVSWFGGPSDTGVSASETGAISGEILRDLNDPLSPSSSTLASRPEDYYFVAMRWCYTPNSRSWWADARIIVKNPTTGAAIVVRPVDWGPNTSTGRIIDLSPQALSDLGLTTDQNALVAFAPPGTALGPVH